MPYGNTEHVEVRQVLYALVDLQSGLREAAKSHAAGSQETVRLGVMEALHHVIGFLNIALPSTSRVPLEQLSEALAMLDAGATGPLLRPCPLGRNGGPLRQPTEADLAALLSAAVTFLLDKTGRAGPITIAEVCRDVARMANKQGFRDHVGEEFVGPQIRTLRNNLLTIRASLKPGRGTQSSAKGLLVSVLRGREQLRHKQFLRLLREYQSAEPTLSRRAIVERAFRAFAMHSPTRRTRT